MRLNIEFHLLAASDAVEPISRNSSCQLVQRQRYESNAEAEHMLSPGERVCREEGVGILDQHNLENDRNDQHHPEQGVRGHVLQDVPLVVDTPRVQLVEDLQCDEHVEHHRVVHRGRVTHTQHRPNRSIKETVSVVHDRQQNDNVAQHLHQDVSHDRLRDQRLGLAIRQAVKQLGSGALRGQSQGGQRIHGQVDPQHLHSSHRRLFQCDGGDKGNGTGNEGHGQLELEELANRVVHISTPHHSLHDRDEAMHPSPHLFP